jgi:hypothetical protein
MSKLEKEVFNEEQHEYYASYWEDMADLEW